MSKTEDKMSRIISVSSKEKLIKSAFALYESMQPVLLNQV